MANAPKLLAAGSAAVGAGERDFDLGAVVECDSSLLACINEWRRQATAAGAGPGDLAVRNAPESIRRIARLYGVESLTLGQ